MPGTEVGVRNIAMNETDKNLGPNRADILMGETEPINR